MKGPRQKQKPALVSRILSIQTVESFPLNFKEKIFLIYVVLPYCLTGGYDSMIRPYRNHVPYSHTQHTRVLYSCTVRSATRVHTALYDSLSSQQSRKPVEQGRPQTFRARRRPPRLGLRKFRLGIDERLFQRARKAVKARRDLARTNTHVGLSRAVPRIVFGRIRLEIRVGLHQRATKIVVLRFELGAPVGRAVFGRQKVSLAKTPRFCRIFLKREGSREVERGQERLREEEERDRQS